MRHAPLSAIAALALASAAWSQPAPLSFEVASIKPAAPCCAPGQWRPNRIEADRIDFQHVSLWYCITYAYGVKSYQVFGPAWLRSGSFDILAKGPAGTRREQLPAMMQTLLAERFKLVVHHETRDTPGLALMVRTGGAKLTEAAEGPGEGDASINMSTSPDGGERLNVKNAPMTTLATTLTALLGNPVVDRTGLTGRYDFVLDFTRDQTAGPRAGGGYNEPPPLPPPMPGAEPGVSIYTSIQRLGLKLDAQKFPLDVVVVDSGEKSPTEN